MEKRRTLLRRLQRTNHSSFFSQIVSGSCISTSHTRCLTTTNHRKNFEVGDETSKFKFARHGSFVQPQPVHQNSWSSDGFLQSYMQTHLPPEVFNDIQPDLLRFGGRVADEIWRLGRECEENQPYLKQYDAWGQRVDELVTCSAWKMQKRIAAEEGLIAIPYENNQGEYSRLYQCAKLFMYGSSSGLFSCPLAMTDAAATTIKSLNLSEKSVSQRRPLEAALARLTSRDPDLFWTSGQWMTEKLGGSDVGHGTETIAVKVQDDVYSLHGYKWFSSATDSDMTITLARMQDSKGEIVEGGKGLSMFFVRTRREDGSLNNIQVVKLKDKLGTRQLPTAELLLDGTEAQLISPEGRGISAISSMLTISRLYNVVMSVSGMRKICSLARDYATRRNAFGTSISHQPLHTKTLANMEIETRGCSVLMLELARQLGMHENNCITDQDALLFRLMTPVAKLYTAKMAVAVTSEGLECFGGQGYIEETGIPGLLRDAQVLPIWEGTTNVLCLDVLRAISKTEGEVLKAFVAKIAEVSTQNNDSATFGPVCSSLEKAVTKTMNLISNLSPKELLLCGRELAFTLAHTYTAALLIQHANRTGSDVDAAVAVNWAARELAPILRSRDSIKQKYGPEIISRIVYQNYEK